MGAYDFNAPGANPNPAAYGPLDLGIYPHLLPLLQQTAQNIAADRERKRMAERQAMLDKQAAEKQKALYGYDVATPAIPARTIPGTPAGVGPMNAVGPQGPQSTIPPAAVPAIEIPGQPAGSMHIPGIEERKVAGLESTRKALENYRMGLLGQGERRLDQGDASLELRRQLAAQAKQRGQESETDKALRTAFSIEGRGVEPFTAMSPQQQMEGYKKAATMSRDASMQQIAVAESTNDPGQLNALLSAHDISPIAKLYIMAKLSAASGQQAPVHEGPNVFERIMQSLADRYAAAENQ